MGGLTIQNSTLNMMQEIKNHQDQVSQTLKSEIRDGIMETMQAFHLSAANQENIPPYMQGYQTSDNFGFNQ